MGPMGASSGVVVHRGGEVLHQNGAGEGAVLVGVS